jgi:hypothetical protein
MFRHAFLFCSGRKVGRAQIHSWRCFPGAHLDEPEEQRFVEADYFMDKRPEVTISRSKPYVCRRSFDRRWWQD